MYKLKDCHKHTGTIMELPTIRCPKCKDHSQNIYSRGDCKELIEKDDGTIMQCQCYSGEHK